MMLALLTSAKTILRPPRQTPDEELVSINEVHR